MSSKLTLPVLFALLIGAGVWSALRPGTAESESPNAAHERMVGIPNKIGPWIGTETDVNPKAMRIAEAEAYLSRSYVHAQTGEAYAVMLLYGSPGGLGAHDPQLCYAGTGFEQRGASTQRAIGEFELWNARFERTTPKAALDVFWGWGTRGEWHAPERARFAFAGEGRIYKIYVQRSISSSASDPVPKPPGEFLEPFLREVKAALEAMPP